MLQVRKYADARGPLVALILFSIFYFLFSIFPFAEAANFNKKPTNLETSTPAESCRARLTWDWAINPSEDEGPSPSIDFQVFLRTGGGGGDAQTPLVFSNTPEKTEARNGAITTYTYSFEQNVPPRSYQYSVLVRGGGNSHDSGWSSPLNITGPSEPTVPTNLVAAWDNAKTSVDLSWEADALPGVTGFEIWRKDGNGDFELKKLIPPSDLLLMFYRDPNVNNAISHTYKIRALNAGEGCDALVNPVPPKFSGYSNEALVEDVPLAPAPPRSMRAELDAASDSKVFLSWEYASGFEGNFRIEYTGALDGTGQPLWETASIRPPVPGGPANFRIEFPGLTPGKKYFFRAQAIRTDARGNGLRSDINAARASVETGVATPVSVGVARVPGAGGTGAAHITWRSVSDIERSFEVEFATSEAGPWQSACSISVAENPGVTECSHENLPLQGTYYYRVYTMGTNGKPSPPSAPPVSVSLDVVPLKGWAWANAGGTQGNVLGVGWISLSSQTPGAGPVSNGGNPYGIFMEKSGGDVRKLSGYAWSGIKCNPSENRGTDASCGYGWLSFEEKDLGGCPSGVCSANVDTKTGKISGWAKFLAADQTPNNWTGWVNLRNEEKGYGACFGDASPSGSFGVDCAGNGNVAAEKAFSGWAWGSVVGGWIQFIGGGGVGPGPGGDCEVTGISIQEPNRSASIGQKVPFTAIPSYNRAGCVSELDWSIKENVTDFSYGTIISLAPDSPNSAEYTAPDSLPSGTAFPFVATIKVQARGTGLFDTRIVQVRDALPQVVAQCANPTERSISVSWSGISPTPNTTKIFRDESPTGSFNTLLHSVRGVGERGTCLDGGGSSGLCSARQGVELDKTYYYKVEVTYADGTVKEGAARSQAECRLATVAPTNVQVFTESDKVLWVNWKDNDTRVGRTFTVERVRVTPAMPEYPQDPAFKRAEAVSDSEIKLQWDNTTNWTPYRHAIARVKEPDPMFLESFAKEGATRDVFKKTPNVVVLEKNEGVPSFLPAPFQVAAKRFTFVDDSLQEGTTYYYRVGSCSDISLRDTKGILQYRTKFLAGLVGKPEIPCGAFAQPVSATTELKVPELLSVEALSSSKVRVTWRDKSSKEGGYEVYRGGTLAHTVAENVTTWDDEGLSSDTTYEYKVRAVKDFGGTIGKVYSRFSEIKSATTHFRITVVKEGVGTGAVTSDVSGINCGATCIAEFPSSYKAAGVTLTAVGSGNGAFQSWTSCPTAAPGNTCVVRGTAIARASFRQASSQLSIFVGGAGTGKISGSVSCVKDTGPARPYCYQEYPPGTNVSLAYEADPGMVFGGWEGPCAGTGACNFILNEDTLINVSFNPEGAFLPSLRNKLVASVYNMSGFVRKVAEPLFTDSIFGRSDILPAKGGVLRSRNIGDVRPRDFGLVGVASLSEIFGGIFERGREALSALFAPKISGAQDAVDYQNYFKPAKVGFKEAALKDEALEPDTVYIYRVKSCAEVNGTIQCTAWSTESAGKTMRNVEQTETGAGDRRAVCTKNSFCNFGAEFAKKISSHVPLAIPEVEESEQQCRVNADCANVGRFEQSFEER